MARMLSQTLKPNPKTENRNVSRLAASFDGLSKSLASMADQMGKTLDQMRQTNAMFEMQMKRQAEMIEQQRAMIQEMSNRGAVVSPIEVAAPEVSIEVPAGERPIRFEIEYDDDDTMIGCVPVYASDMN